MIRVPTPVLRALAALAALLPLSERGAVAQTPETPALETVSPEVFRAVRQF